MEYTLVTYVAFAQSHLGGVLILGSKNVIDALSEALSIILFEIQQVLRSTMCE